MNDENKKPWIKKITDGYTNAMARLGIGTQNLTSGGHYKWDGLVNNRQELEHMFMYSWVAKQAIELPAKDMTRAGITLLGLDEDEVKILQRAIIKKNIWRQLFKVISWARLYGGALCYIRIDGQDPSTPLDINTITKKQFVGLDILSRWQVTPSIGQMIRDNYSGQDEPEYYMSVIDNSLTTKPFQIHHSRVIKFIGNDVPWLQKIALLFWGQSVLVNIHSQIKSYDAIKTMIDQMANKAHIRTLKIEGMKELLAMGGEDGEAELMKYVNAIRLTQSTEDITVIDSNDDFEAAQYNFAGLKDIMEIAGEQISGATGIPQAKLFGRQADGLGASHAGDQDFYLANIENERELELRIPLTRIFDVLSLSELGKPLPDEFSFTFDSLEQLNDDDVSKLGSETINTIATAFEKNLISQEEAREQLVESSVVTKLFYNLNPKQLPEPIEVDVPDKEEDAGDE